MALIGSDSRRTLLGHSEFVNQRLAGEQHEAVVREQHHAAAGLVRETDDVIRACGGRKSVGNTPNLQGAVGSCTRAGPSDLDASRLRAPIGNAVELIRDRLDERDVPSLSAGLTARRRDHEFRTPFLLHVPTSDFNPVCVGPTEFASIGDPVHGREMGCRWWTRSRVLRRHP
jgi:hypothetical protein